jgi:hypothetical protein
MTKMPYVDFDFDSEIVRESKEVHTNCASVSILNQGNCTLILDNNTLIPAGGGLNVSYNGYGIPRLTRRLAFMFKDDNTETKVSQVLVVRTIIKSICYE